MFDLSQYLEERRARVDAELERLLPPADTPPALLHQAMRYAVLGAGKRLRPILCEAAADAAGGSAEALPAGAAVEIVHAYTLVHDDLPCMDDDTERRGRPTCHVRFGEANALLAGDALLALAFEVLAGLPGPHAAARVRELALAAGSRGVVGGQVDDLAADPPTRERVTRVHQHKTADLFRAAIRLGALSAGAAPEILGALTDYANHLGHAFQITDDILDAPERQPGETDGASILDVMTLAEAQDLLDRHRREGHQALAAAPLHDAGTVPLAAILEWIVRRRV